MARGGYQLRNCPVGYLKGLNFAHSRFHKFRTNSLHLQKGRFLKDFPHEILNRFPSISHHKRIISSSKIHIFKISILNYSKIFGRSSIAKINSSENNFFQGSTIRVHKKGQFRQMDPVQKGVHTFNVPIL